MQNSVILNPGSIILPVKFIGTIFIFFPLNFLVSNLKIILEQTYTKKKGIVKIQCLYFLKNVSSSEGGKIYKHTHTLLFSINCVCILSIY